MMVYAVRHESSDAFCAPGGAGLPSRRTWKSMRRAEKRGPMRPTTGWIVGVLSSMSIPVTAWAQQRPSDYWGIHPFWGAWGIGMMLMLLVLCGVVILALVLGIGWLSSQGREPRTDSPLDALKTRYARGEIDKEEYEARKRDLPG